MVQEEKLYKSIAMEHIFGISSMVLQLEENGSKMVQALSFQTVPMVGNGK